MEMALSFHLYVGSWNGTEVPGLARQVPLSAESSQRPCSNNLDVEIIQ